MPLQERFVHNLKRYREQLGCTQEQLGTKLGTDRTVISRYERTSSRMNLERADMLARALDIDVRVLLETPVNKTLVHKPPGKPISSELVGAKVREVRTISALSQREIGDRIGMDRNHLSRIETKGADVAILLSTLEKLAQALGVKPTDLL